MHCCILSDFPYELYYDAQIRERQVHATCISLYVLIYSDLTNILQNKA